MVKWTGFTILTGVVLAVGVAFGYSLTHTGSPKTVAASVHHYTIDYKVVASDDPAAAIGPDGKPHDTFRPTAPLPQIHVGDIVTVRVTNYDDMAHGMLFADLKMSEMLTPAKDDSTPGVTTFTFPTNKAGTFRWFCPIPCDSDQAGWAMTTAATGPSQDGFMAGSITVA